LEAYNLKQEGAAGRAYAASLVGVALLYLSYFGFRPTESLWSYLLPVVLLIAPWFFYRAEFKKNANALFPEPNSPTSTNELIRQEWEWEYIMRERGTESY
jgi:hypothetical protein